MKNKLQESAIAQDTLKGLSSDPKFLMPKYFYDENGSKIFQNIMNMQEYYLTDCETEIFTKQKSEISEEFVKDNQSFELIELGSGDGFKTKILLRFMHDHNYNFKFIPIDISPEITDILVSELRSELPGMNVEPKTGDYFQVLKDISGFSNTRKIILFLGANIGNYSTDSTKAFIKHVSEFMTPGDKIMIGFDLKKSPDIILKAYNDPNGHTRDFNLNHLARLNSELGANFDLKKFVHHATYNPISGDVKSFLISTEKQEAKIKALKKNFLFEQWEAIFMELSKKYSLSSIKRLAEENGFSVAADFTDRKNYFVDSLWIKK